MYFLIRAALFRLDPERAHYVALNALRRFAWWFRLGNRDGISEPVELLGLSFPNRVGLAAGFDKNGEYLDALSSLGFGFLEIGTVTPRPQPGNPKPRIFRLISANALINRLGFNNQGCKHLTDSVKNSKYQGILGVNIGKNHDTRLENAYLDYVKCLRDVYDIADYVVVNVSSPNTPDLRRMQVGSLLKEILGRLTEARENLAEAAGKRVPILVKVAPDLTCEEIDLIGQMVRSSGIEGVVATNTTATRDESLTQLPHGREDGGLSGRPLHRSSEAVIKQFRSVLNPTQVIIGVGGVMGAADAKRHFDAGADLVQVYTGLIYRGPGLVNEIVDSCAR